MDWFLYDNGLRHERVKSFSRIWAKFSSVLLLKTYNYLWRMQRLGTLSNPNSLPKKQIYSKFLIFFQIKTIFWDRCWPITKSFLSHCNPYTLEWTLIKHIFQDGYWPSIELLIPLYTLGWRLITPGWLLIKHIIKKILITWDDCWFSLQFFNKRKLILSIFSILN